MLPFSVVLGLFNDAMSTTFIQMAVNGDLVIIKAEAIVAYLVYYFSIIWEILK